MKKLITILAALAFVAPSLSRADVVHGVQVGGPVYPTSTLSADAVDVANVLVKNLDAVQKKLSDNALLGKVSIGNGWLQQKQPIGADNRIYQFRLTECTSGMTGVCETAGYLLIKQSKFLRPGEEVISYTVEVNLQ